MHKRNLFLAAAILFATATYSQDNFWKDIPRQNMEDLLSKRKIQPSKYRTVELDINAFEQFAKALPAEGSAAVAQQNNIISIPMPDGSFSRFSMVQSPIMEPPLAAKFPSLKTYSGKGIDDKTAVIKIDRTKYGFHAMILSPVTGSVFIDPVDNSSVTTYLSYYKKDVTPSAFFEAEVRMVPGSINQPDAPLLSGESCIGTELRTYRLAVACTGEYAQSLGAVTKEETLSFIVTSVNRVDGVYETELAIRMVLVANEDKVVFTNPATDPFNGNYNGGLLLSENQKVVTDSIGTANYDIGHVFSTGGGGVAYYAVVCNSNYKARGVTGLDYPAGDPYDIDYVAHEMGHQFSGSHTFNTLSGACNGNGSQGYNAEPGSGSTIMAYAGICGSNDLQPHSDAQFHAVNRDEMLGYTNFGYGNTCAVVTASGNQPPLANAGKDYIIPLSTPFTVTGTGSDPDGDAVSFDWEEIDVNGPFGNWNTPSGTAPQFRSFIPSVSPVRNFPQITDVVNNLTSVGEILPSYDRFINLRLTVRDNRYGGGGVCNDDMRIRAFGEAGPFVVTAPAGQATTWNTGGTYMVTWDVANTSKAPINCYKVNILLSADGGLSFPYTLITNTANDGSQEITVPDNVEITTSARVKVEAANSIFYNVSNSNFIIGSILPLQWLSVTAEKTGTGSALIKWSTSGESGNDYFEVERSIAGTSFNKIGTVAAGTGFAAVHQYSFNDKFIAGTNYYRIKQVDKDGRSGYSKIIQLTADANGVQWTVQPNPAKTSTTIRFTDISKVKTVLINNAQGKTIYKNNKVGNAVNNSIEIQLGSFTKGMYFITVITESGTKTEKLIVN
ncbi:MAG TPA: M12 family metallo-peptidase [Panacibacter sp.]|nr:M12 family metallo-peptidase [Panacibacter sp.]